MLFYIKKKKMFFFYIIAIVYRYTSSSRPHVITYVYGIKIKITYVIIIFFFQIKHVS